MAEDAKQRSQELKQRQDAKMAEDKRKLAAQKEAREKQHAEIERRKGRPTPTQEECDLLKLGNHPELSDDGSGPDPFNPPEPGQEEESGKRGGAAYSHRQATPAPSGHTSTQSPTSRRAE
jgi:hypothetical protein